jgi:cystathionine beta-synthase
MDVLVVVGAEPPPHRLADRARHIHRMSDGEALPALIGDLRARIPRQVGVWGPVEEASRVAGELREAGLPTELFTDEPLPAGVEERLTGVDVRAVADPGDPMDVAESLVDLIGRTPMMRLDRTARALECTLLAKLEMFNPGGSSKDRIALAMVEAAERDGQLAPGGTIVEPTSGNTGVGLAIVAARRGYRCIFVCPDKVATDKIALLRAYGAEVVVCPTSVEPEHPDSYYSVSDRLAAEVPGAWKPDQYHNPANPQAQYDTTGREIWEQTRGRVTHFVAGIGTGGTISGIGRYLKEQNPAVQVIGADPEGSVYSGGTGRPYLVEGIGEDFWPTTYDPGAVDRVIALSDATSFATARRVTREEGLLLGGSGGTAVAAALVAGRDLPADAVVVVLIPDSGRGYLSKLYNDSWMADYGFLQEAGRTVGDVLAQRDSAIPTLVHVHPDETVRAAIAVIREYGVSQVPVVKHEPPVVLAEVVGSVTERGLLERALSDPAAMDRTVGEVMEAPLPTLGHGPAGPGPGAPRRAGHPFGHPVVPGRGEELMAVPELGARGFETRAVHGGGGPDPQTGAVNTPVYLTSTFEQDAVGSPRGYEYARSGNPSRASLEAHLAVLEGGRWGYAFASGLAAEDAVMRLLAPGRRLLMQTDSYGGTYRLATKVHQPAGLVVETSDLSDPAAALESGPDMVWIETPTNPLLHVVDIEAVAELAHRRGAIVVVDNTFATPWAQQPLKLGADIVIHSTTKYLGGHSDVVGGFAATDDEELASRIGFLQNSAGAVPGPFDCFLVQRGIKTLPLRMERHCANALAVVEMLGAHPRVSSVLHPSLPGHPGHLTAARQMRGFGGIVSFIVEGGEAAAVRVCSSTRIFTLAESLGAVESLIEHPGRMTHASTAGTGNAVPDDLIRLSVGVETADDLVADLRQALDALG